MRQSNFYRNIITGWTERVGLAEYNLIMIIHHYTVIRGSRTNVLYSFCAQLMIMSLQRCDMSYVATTPAQARLIITICHVESN